MDISIGYDIIDRVFLCINSNAVAGYSLFAVFRVLITNRSFIWDSVYQ